MRIGHLLGIVPALLVACAVDRPAPSPSGPAEAPPVEGQVAPHDKLLELGPVVRAPVAPAPIIGGTLATTRLGNRELAIASDTDRDRVLIFDLDAQSLAAEIQLDAGDEPGRVAVSGHLAHVVLRRAGIVATIDLASGALLARREVCASPRGIAFASASGLVHVACLGGELVSFAPGRDSLMRTLHLAPDLRDVVVDGDKILVSHFRSTEVDVLSTKGVFQRRLTPSAVDAPKPSGAHGTFVPTVAWRMIGLPGGGAVVAHQRALSATIDLDPHASPVKSAAYGLGGCSAGVVHSALTFLRGGAATLTLPPIGQAALPVDVAVSPSGDRFALVLAGNEGAAQVRVLSADGLDQLETDACHADGTSEALVAGWGGKVVAASFAPSNRLVVQTREPAGVAFDGHIVTVPGRPVADTGHQIFHMDPGVGIACASCHPEGGEDGRVWRFEHVGPRRTPALRGGIMSTAPFHWAGDLPDFRALVSDVFVGRMGGRQPLPEHVEALGSWVDTIEFPRVAPPADAVAVDRGRVLFASDDVGCATCHSGDKLTNNATVAVGTGEPLQVPSLRGLSLRAPYLHNGCAATIADRFGPCGGGSKHGNVESLSAQQMADLLAYLASL